MTRAHSGIESSHVNMNRPPLPESTLLTAFRRLFTPLLTRSCVYCQFVPGGGKRVIVQQFLSDTNRLQDFFGDSYEKNLFVYVNPDEIEDSASVSYIKLMRKSLETELTTRHVRLAPICRTDSELDGLKELLRVLTEDGYNVAFILNDFEFTLALPISIYLNLESIRAIDPSMIVFMFLTSINVFHEDFIGRMGNLKYSISHHRVYHPLLEHADANYLFNRFSGSAYSGLPTPIRTLLHEYCGGHPQLIRYGISVVNAMDQLERVDVERVRLQIESDPQLQMICTDIWHSFWKSEKEILQSLARHGTLTTAEHDHMQFAFELGVLQKTTDTHVRFFCRLFAQYVKKRIPMERFVFDEAKQQLYFGAVNCTKSFTPAEFAIFCHMLRHEGDVVSRDDIATTLWKQLSFEKYSDYTIDKHISTIRKKLEAMGFRSSKLVTLKKRGFFFSH